MSELVFAAEQIEDASHYDWGAQQADVSSSNTATQTKPVPERVWATYMPRPSAGQGQWPRAVVDHGPPRTLQARLSVAQNSTSHSETGQMKPGNRQLGGMTGQKQTEHICGCGKVSHIQANCPIKKARSCVAAAVCIQKAVDTGTTGDVAPADDAQEGETPPEGKDTE